MAIIGVLQLEIFEIRRHFSFFPGNDQSLCEQIYPNETHIDHHTTFLCDRHPEFQLAPGVDDAERGLFLQWLFFFSSSVQNAYQMSYYPWRFCDSNHDEASVNRRSVTRLRELWQVVDDAIGDNDWLLGKHFSAADIYLFMLTTWLSESHNHPSVDSFVNVNRVATATMQRPSIQLVYQS